MGLRAFPFDPNPEWSHFYSRSHEILDTPNEIVKKWDLVRNVQFKRRAKGVYWQEDRTWWKLIAEDVGEDRIEHADVLISASAFITTWSWPSIPGLHDFRGHKVSLRRVG